ncbi:GNAT family N-acetyltransferase [Paenibacillus sp. D51F]
MEFKIRPLVLPDDYEGIAAVWNEELSEPTTAESLAEADSKLYEQGHLHMNADGLLEGYDRFRRVAVNDDGRIAGYLWTWRAPWTEAGGLYHTLVVSKAFRGLGVGRALLGEAAAWASAIGADRIYTEVWDDDLRSLRFAEQSGFEIERRSWQSVLDLNHVEEAAALADGAVIERLESEGIRFVSLADMPEEDREQLLYELESPTFNDIPGFLGTPPGFGDWQKWNLRGDGYAPERVILALDGDRYVGDCNLRYFEETRGMYHEYTCVHRDYRGRGIARALKILSIRLAVRTGALYLRTDNDSLNEPMLAVNRNLGYRSLRGKYRIKGDVGSIAAANRKLDPSDRDAEISRLQ